MTAIKKNFLIAISLIAVFFAGIFIFASCAKTEDLKVSFMVENSNNEWALYQEVEIIDGKVEMPTNPEKEYYNFSNWYLNEDFTGDPFTNSNLLESLSVYARFVPVEVEIVINGENEGRENLVDVVNGTYEVSDDLEFSGWYTNSNFTEDTKWDGTSLVTTLYARSVARVTFNNGYEDLYTTTVAPESLFTDPKAEGGIESTDIIKDYMSKYDIVYLDEDGNQFDFTKPITKNTNITVSWRSPFLLYEVNETTGNLIVTMYGGNKNKYDDTDTSVTSETVPVIRIPGSLSFDKDGDGVVENYKVEEVNLNANLLSGSQIEKLIIDEGIKVIQNLNSSTATTLKEVSLPSSLQVIINSFNNLNSLEGVTLPENVEVIINSFFANTTTSWNYLSGFVNKGDAYSFDIDIPSSVKNLSMIPSNFKFSKTKDTATTGDFYKDGNYVYKVDDNEAYKDKLLLIADFTEGTSVKVPEGVNGIQVGTYFNRSYEYLTLPSTFEYIGYNEDVSSYEYYTFEKSNYYITKLLYDKEYAESPRGNITPAGYAIFNNLDGLTNLVFYSKKLESTSSNYAFIGDPTGYGSYNESRFEPYTATSYQDIVIYVGETDNPEVNVTLNNTLTDKTYTVTINKNKDSSLTIDEILEAIDSSFGTKLLTEYKESKVLNVDSVKLYGIDYNLEEKLTTNLYLTITTSYQNLNGGYTFEVNDTENTATITGYQNDGYLTSDNLVIVSIPETVTKDNKTYTVTAIKDSAFDATLNSNAINIGYVIIPNTVKTIGEKAFYGCEGLTNVSIEAGSLEVIGKSAFEGTSLETIKLPLSNLKEVGPYAFKIETLKEFLPAEGEEDRNMLDKVDLKEGDFFIYEDTVDVIGYTTIVKGGYGLMQFVSKETSEDGVNTYNVKFVASAGGVNSTTVLAIISLGNVSDTKNLISFEIMEGSYYFVNNGPAMACNIKFNLVSKIHTNAFTDSNLGSAVLIYSRTYMGNVETRSPTLLSFMTSYSTVFEENWCDSLTDELKETILSRS